MKTRILLIILLVTFSCNLFSGKLLFADFSWSTSVINNSKDFDNYYRNLYDDYKSSFLPTTDFTFGVGHRFFNDKFVVLVDWGIKHGSIVNKNKTQYKMIHTTFLDLTGEYKLFSKNNFNYLLKTGLGMEHNIFLYNRNNPLFSNTIEFNNYFVPICFTFAFENLRKASVGPFLQVNIPVHAGNVNSTGLDVKVPNVPSIYQNWLSFGLKVRLP